MDNLKDLDQPVVETDFDLGEKNKNINDYHNGEVDQNEAKINQLNMEISYLNTVIDRKNESIDKALAYNRKINTKLSNQTTLKNLLKEQLDLNYKQMQHFRKMYNMLEHIIKQKEK